MVLVEHYFLLSSQSNVDIRNTTLPSKNRIVTDYSTHPTVILVIHPMPIIGRIVPRHAYMSLPCVHVFSIADAYAVHHQHTVCLN